MHYGVVGSGFFWIWFALGISRGINELARLVSIRLSCFIVVGLITCL